MLTRKRLTVGLFLLSFIASPSFVFCGGPSSVTPSGPRSFVLFRYNQDALLPVACYDVVAGKYAGNCAKLVSPPTRVTDLLGSSVTLGKAIDVHFCPYLPKLSAPGFGFRHDSDPKGAAESKLRSAYLVWPGAAAATTRLLPNDKPEVDAKLRSRLSSVLLTALGDPTGQTFQPALDIRQQVQSDLDGDGKPEQVFSVHALRKDRAAVFSDVGTLLLISGSAPSRIQRLTSIDGGLYHQWRIVSLLDLDSDGQREIIAEYDYRPFDGSTDGEGGVVFRRDPNSDRWEGIGEWSCIHDT